MSYFREESVCLGVCLGVVKMSAVIQHTHTSSTLTPTPASWGEKDSNLRRLRQQIYSLPHLTALVSPQIDPVKPDTEHHSFKELSRWTDSNRRPADYKSAALPAELHRHLFKKDCKSINFLIIKQGFFTNNPEKKWIFYDKTCTEVDTN